MNSSRIIVFDTETTGLLFHRDAPIEAQPRIIEFAAIILEKGKEVACDSMLINPGHPITAEITEITGLTDADLVEEPSFTQRLPQLQSLFAGCDTVMAHNLQFDRGMFFAELARAQVTDFPWPKRELCTVELAADLWGYYPKLRELYFDIIYKPLEQTHRAMDDVKALVEIVKKAWLWKV
jgi:DNA polymerase III epsilon subunit-like protein